MLDRNHSILCQYHEGRFLLFQYSRSTQPLFLIGRDTAKSSRVIESIPGLFPG